MKRKTIGIILSIVILLVIVCIGYLTINGNFKKMKLEGEIKSLVKLDIKSDDFNRKIVSSGDYAVVEKAIKDYLSEYSSSIKEINSMVTADSFSKLLSYDNLSNDPDFANSINQVNTSLNRINELIDKLINMSSKESIINNIEQYKLDDYYNNIYIDLMINDDVLSKLEISRNDLEKYRESVTTKLNTCNEIFFFLNSNTKNYIFDEGQLKFTSEALMEQYNNYVKKIRG